jgi:hypothetical protein
MHRPILGKTGTLLFDVFIEVLELASIILGFYAIMHTSSEPLIKNENNVIVETQLFVNLAVETRAYVIAAMSLFVVVVLLRTVVRRLIHTTE